MEVEFPEIFNLRSDGSAQSLWVAIQEQEMKHPLTLVEEKMKTEEDSREKITQERMWSNRPVCTLIGYLLKYLQKLNRQNSLSWSSKESDFTDIFITGGCSLNEQDLLRNLEFFKVPEGGIETLRPLDQN